MKHKLRKLLNFFADLMAKSEKLITFFFHSEIHFTPEPL